MVQSMDEWLTRHGLGQYRQLFVESRIDLDVMAALSEQDLRELGLPLGDRKRLLAAVQSTLGRQAALGAHPAPTREVEISDGERRQLTVLFCDLVGYTELATRLDPEVLQEIVRAYEDTCAVCITRFEGYVFQRLGDGIVAFFGYPLAHEGEAQRAIHAGLAILEAMSRLQVADAGRLAVRIGIATGVVVVSSVEKGAVGETMNLAARLQGVAAVNSVVVSERVRRLAGGTFEYVDLGEKPLKGIAQPTRVYRVVKENEAGGRFEAATQAGLTDFVGREQELSLLLGRWEQSQAGEGQVVLLSGEPGIGKSRLLSAVRERLEQRGARALRYQCSPYHVNSAYHPFINHLERELELQREEAADAKLDKLEAFLQAEQRPRADARFLGAMLSLPVDARYGPLAMTPQRLKDETLRALVELLESGARRQQSLMLFEDAHWADPTSLELLDVLTERAQDAPFLLLITHRPEFHNRWAAHGHVTSLNLAKLGRAQSAAMMNGIAKGKALPGDLQERILAKTDGIPLFVEELTKVVLESTALAEREDRYVYVGEAANLEIPATLHDSLMARLDRDPSMKEVAQMGAVIGREFSHELLEAISGKSAQALAAGLQRLTEAGLAHRRGTPPAATYTFKHALVQDIAYDSLLKSTRVALHRRLAQALEERFAHVIADEPALAARHFDAAGHPEKAVAYWLGAAVQASGRAANAEAVSNGQRGLKCIALLPQGEERDVMELSLRVTAGWALIASQGYAIPEVREMLDAARALSSHVGERADVASIYAGLHAFYIMRADFDETSELVARLKGLESYQRGEPSVVMTWHILAGWNDVFVGRFRQAAEHAPAALEIFLKHGASLAAIPSLALVCNVSMPMDLMAWSLWPLGHVDQSRARAQQGLEALGTQGSHLMKAHLLAHGAVYAQFSRDAELTLRRADETIAYSLEVGNPTRRIEGEILKGWALTELGNTADGIPLLERAVSQWNSLGSRIANSYWNCLLAEAYGGDGRWQQARGALVQARQAVEQTGERFWEAEVCRLEGDLALAMPPADAAKAENRYREAIEVARKQQARSFELRASVCLARLWRSQGNAKQARDLLAPVYEWFTEGFDTRDLQEAKALLHELRVYVGDG